VSDAEEEFSIDYEDICTTNISDDSGFIEVSTPSTPATPYRQREDSSIFTLEYGNCAHVLYLKYMNHFVKILKHKIRKSSL
jgi:hypothetical protein